MQHNWFILFFGFLIINLCGSNALADEGATLWEYGVGFGFTKFEQYPSSNQYNNLFLPFPTFQYRGKIVRADDREGTRAYLIKEKMWSVELSGGGYVGLDSSTNDARRGMSDVPWNFHIGPQLVYNFSNEFDFRVGLFQAATTDFRSTSWAGQVSEAKLIYQWESILTLSKNSPSYTSNGRLSIGVKGGTSEFLSTYFEVAPNYATTNRSSFEAKAGLLNSELTYFQSLKIEKASLYLGIAVLDYRNSANKLSPLHKLDYNTSYLVGLTYVLGESKRPAILEENTDGLIKNSR